MKKQMLVVVVFILYLTIGAFGSAGSGAPSGYTLRGTVIDVSSDVSQESFLKLALLGLDIENSLVDGGAKYNEQFDRMFDERSCSNAMVYLEGNGLSRVTTTDVEGNFHFQQIPSGSYTLSASVSSLLPDAGNKVSNGYTQILHPPDYSKSSANIQLRISTHAITAKGRVVTVENEPLQGVTVSAIYRFPEELGGNIQSDYYNHISTVTDSTGTYTLSGIIPPSILTLASLLGSETLAERYELQICKDNTILTPLTPACFIPLSEELRQPCLKIWMLFSLFSGKDIPWPIKDAPRLPKSKGNIIFVDDIILEKIEDAAPIME